MTWLAWRRHRSMLTALFVVLVFAAAALALRPLGFHDLPFGLTGRDFLDLGGGILMMLPVLIGTFLAVPASAGELERRTHVFVWSQSVSRDRWLGTHLTVVGIPALLGVAVLGLSHRWVDPYSDLNWGTEPILVPLAYTVFAVAFGAAFGLLLRRTVPAMGVTLVVLFYVRFVVDSVVPYLWPREVVTAALAKGDPRYADLPENSLSIESGFVGPTGNLLSYGSVDGCEYAEISCLREQGVTGYWLSYHPPEAYWALQLLEIGLYLAAAAVLLGGAFYLIRKRSTA